MQIFCKLKSQGHLRKGSLQNLWIKSYVKIDFEADDEEPEDWIKGIFMTTMMWLLQFFYIYILLLVNLTYLKGTKCLQDKRLQK